MRWLRPEELVPGMLVYGTRDEGPFGYCDKSKKKGWTVLEKWGKSQAISLSNEKAGIGPSRVGILSGDLVEVDYPDPWPDPAYGETSL